MQCPNCNTIGMSGDRNCMRCGARLSRGVGRNLPHTVGMGFAFGMILLLVAARPIPPTKFNQAMAWGIVCGLACMAAGAVGTFVGWVIQKVTD